MPDPIAAVAGATVSPAAGVNPLDLYAAPSQALDQNSAIDQEAFLKLLVAQLTYQDPLEPTSNEAFISLTAQFTTVERLNELADQGRSRVAGESLNTAAALVGRTISFLDELGRAVQATVDQATIIGGDVRLVTDRGGISLDQIIAIGARADGTSPAPSIPIQKTTAETSPTPTPSQEATVQ